MTHVFLFVVICCEFVQMPLLLPPFAGFYPPPSLHPWGFLLKASRGSLRQPHQRASSAPRKSCAPTLRDDPCCSRRRRSRCAAGWHCWRWRWSSMRFPQSFIRIQQ